MLELSKAQARRLILHGQGLLDPPQSQTDCLAIVQQLGYVQLDSINVLERAHHLILGTRMDRYRRPLLKQAVEKRTLFEEWTHDACLIPMEFEPHWGVRRERFAQSIWANRWWKNRMGTDPAATQRKVLRRLEKEGPLPTRAFREKGRQREAWWGWTPEKTALEYCWRVGLLAVSGREGFEKIYDLAERVLPPVARRPDREATLAWSCEQALQRLGLARTSELAAFWNFFNARELEPWCQESLAQVGFEGEAYWVRPDFESLLERPAPGRLRLLSPFDPLVRDRARLERFFDFFYRFEAFVPRLKREYGYYVLPMLMGERLVGRLDAKFERKRGELRVLGVWWELGERAKTVALDRELARLARRLGAERVVWV